MEILNLEGKTVIVTGSSSGIGTVTAKVLAEKGARVIMANRNEEKTEVVRQDIINRTGNQNVVFMKLDLSSLDSIKEFATTFNADENRLDILVNNAGVLTSERTLTKDGHEMMFGTNHLGSFLLTNLLLDKLKASAPSRIVNVSSLLHESNPVRFDDLECSKNFNSMTVYGASKSANILFSVHLAKILEGTKVTSYALHPGAIPSTALSRDICCYGTCCFTCIFSCVAKLLFNDSVKTLDEGALTTLFCCLEPSISSDSGRYYKNEMESTAKPHATNPESAERLWQISLDMCKDYL